MTFSDKLISFLALLVFTFGVYASSANSMPPHPQLLENGAAAKSVQSYFMQNIDELRAKGICTADEFLSKKDFINASKLSPGAITTFRVLAILVKFSDNDSSVSATFFDSLVFGSSANTVRDYFDEISYSQFDLVTVNMPSSIGWQTAPQTYAYYVNGQNATGTYPQNSQKLLEDLVDAVDGVVDFSLYDNDLDGYVDVVLVIHSGTGAEFTSNNDDIWSHKWSITPRAKDGVWISSYTIQPEFWIAPGDMTIGVYAHELSHVLGLPDLYDTDYSSNGIGNWALMSLGSWNGPSPGGSSPSHPCAWSRIQLGFATSTNVTSNTNGVAISNVNQNGTIYRLWTSGNIGNEYFLVENRQKLGYDSYIPQSGLLVWHIDNSKGGNTQEWYPGQTDANHFKVALEQADGLFEMDQNIDNGDAWDVFPGTGNVTSFNAVSSPNSDSYTDGTSFVALENINAVGNVINADLIVGFAAGIDDDQNGNLPSSIALEQNYPNPFNPSTTIDFSLSYSSDVTLEVYNVLGKLTGTLINGPLSAGNYSVEWNGTDNTGNNVASGIYFYRLNSNGEAKSMKMLLLK
ncbi:MAG: M6 family metalloprotease domain-containing protein [candidate division Zixibacteria bacterium]|nr:M6 family metalloprotease domain-containing protein [candidate division Zixibacteria bacterium]